MSEIETYREQLSLLVDKPDLLNTSNGIKMFKDLTDDAVNKYPEFLDRYYGGAIHYNNWINRMGSDRKFASYCIAQFKDNEKPMTPEVVSGIKDGKDAYTRFMVAMAGRFDTTVVEEQKQEEQTMTAAINAGLSIDGTEWYDTYFTSKEVFDVFIKLPINNMAIFNKVMALWLGSTDLTISRGLMNPFSKEHKKIKEKQIKDAQTNTNETPVMEEVITPKEEESIKESINESIKKDKKKNKKKDTKKTGKSASGGSATTAYSTKDYLIAGGALVLILVGGYYGGKALFGSDDSDVIVIDNELGGFAEFL